MSSEFKIGDRVRFIRSVSNVPGGAQGEVVGREKRRYEVRFDGFSDGHRGSGPFGHTDRWFCEPCDIERLTTTSKDITTDDITPPSTVLSTYIVCVIDHDGTPLPSERPVTHEDHGAAYEEATRLAKAHGGQVFGVFGLHDALKFKTIPPVPARQEIEVLF